MSTLYKGEGYGVRVMIRPPLPWAMASLLGTVESLPVVQISELYRDYGSQLVDDAILKGFITTRIDRATEMLLVHLTPKQSVRAVVTLRTSKLPLSARSRATGTLA